MEELSKLIGGTPWWVFVIFLYLMMIGIKAAHPRTLPVQQLFILPALFFAASVIWLYHRLHGHIAFFGFWVVGIGLGALLGHWLVRKWTVHADRAKQILSIPGSYTILFLVFAIFIVRYFFGYQYSVHPERASHLFLPDALISGIILGIFIGRSYSLYRKYLGKR